MLAPAVTIWKIIAVTTFVVNGTPMDERNPHPLTFENEMACQEYAKTDQFRSQWAQFRTNEMHEHGPGTKVVWACQEGMLIDDDQPEERGA